jgi:hypothetical protein
VRRSSCGSAGGEEAVRADLEAAKKRIDAEVRCRATATARR